MERYDHLELPEQPIIDELNNMSRSVHRSGEQPMRGGTQAMDKYNYRKYVYRTALLALYTMEVAERIVETQKGYKLHGDVATAILIVDVEFRAAHIESMKPADAFTEWKRSRLIEDLKRI